MIKHETFSRRTKVLREALNKLIEKEPNKDDDCINNILKYTHIHEDKSLTEVTFERKKGKYWYWEFIDVQEST